MNYRPPEPAKSAETVPQGAYGLRLEGFSSPLLNPSSPHWPRATISQKIGRRDLEPVLILDETARLSLEGGGRIDSTRSPLAATITFPRPLDHDELIHPFLTATALVFVHWLGHQPFHGGALLIEGRAWAVLGAKEAGKSTLLAAMALMSTPVMADDLLVIREGHKAMAGSRTIDLRPDVVPYLRSLDGTRLVRQGTRQRLNLEPVPSEVPFAGWVLLKWGPTTRLRRLPLKEKMKRIFQERSLLGVELARPEAALDLVSLPAYELERERSWETMSDVHTLLRDSLGSTA